MEIQRKYKKPNKRIKGGKYGKNYREEKQWNKGNNGVVRALEW